MRTFLAFITALSAGHCRRWSNLFLAIDKFANDRRLANLLKLLVVLICLGAILRAVSTIHG
jgi:hypothetical protein